MWYDSVSPIRVQVCLPYSITLWYLTLVHLGYTMVHRYVTLVWLILIYTMPYPHLATYTAITITKGTLWCPQSTLWYHNINISRLYKNATVK